MQWAEEKAQLAEDMPQSDAQELLAKALREGRSGKPRNLTHALKAVKRALACGADPNAGHYNETCGVGGNGGCESAVFVAANLGRIHELRFMLAAGGGDPNVNSGKKVGYSNSGRRTPFYKACYRGHHDCLRVLTALGATPDHSIWRDCDRCKCPSDIPHSKGCRCVQCMPERPENYDPYHHGNTDDEADAIPQAALDADEVAACEAIDQAMSRAGDDGVGGFAAQMELLDAEQAAGGGGGDDESGGGGGGGGDD